MLSVGGSVRSGVLQLPVRGLCSAAFNNKSPPPGHTWSTPPSARLTAVRRHMVPVRMLSGGRTLSDVETLSDFRTLSGVGTLSDVRTLCVGMLPGVGTLTGGETLPGVRTLPGVGTLSGVRRLSGVGMLSGVRRSSGVGTLPGVGMLSGVGTLSGVRRLSGGDRDDGAGAGAAGWYGSLSDSAPVHLCEHFLVSTQQASGLPWWLSIVVATLSVRTLITLPLATYQMVIIAKVEALQAEISQLAKRLRYEVSVRAAEKGWTEKQSRFQFKKNLRRIVSQLYIRDNCHPFKASLLVWVQLPLWISLSLALRNISLDQSGQPSDLAAGGALWFPDLTLPDSTWILPVCLGLTNLLIVEVFSLQRVNPSRVQRIMTNAIRAFSVLMIPIAAAVPSSMALYWFTSSLVGFSHNLVLRSPTVHKLLKLQTPRSESPYRDLLSAFISKYCK